MKRGKTKLQQRIRKERPGKREESLRARHVLVLAAFAMICGGLAGMVQAQSGKLGAYAGTVVISGTEVDHQKKVNFSASLKIHHLPLVSGDNNSAIAELSDVDKPSATALITRWDLVNRSASPDADGKFTSWKCSLAAPTEVPMISQGTLNLDYRAKKYSMYFALAAIKPIPLKCVNSRSGPYKKEEPVSLFFGTSEPDVVPWKVLPFADAARLTAKYKLVPVSFMKERYGPVDLEWDLRLQR